jgi:acyl-CoA reductase-like NAD-dependent aldehyde dehydrogenase
MARDQGAQVLAGGGPPSEDDLRALEPSSSSSPSSPPSSLGGFYWRPTVPGGLPHDSCAVQEEVFGPPVTVHPFVGDVHAVALANDTV